MPKAILAEVTALGVNVERVNRVLVAARGDFRQELVTLRKAIITHVSNIQAMLDKPGSVVPPAATAVIRSHLSAARTAMALHQATWPAVKIDENVDAYRLSAQAVTAEFHKFIDTVRLHLR